jgi:hypothetical protein
MWQLNQKTWNDMKIYAKPIVAPASGAILLCSVLCQTAQAQSVVLNTQEQSVLAAVSGATGENALAVNWEVSYNSGVYTYSYTVQSPIAAEAASFSVGFDTAATDPVDISGDGAINYSGPVGIGVIWSPLLNTSAAAGVGPGQTSQTLTFESDDPPILGNANVNGSDPNGPWASNPYGQQVPIPSAVPEPATTTLLALTLLLLPFRSTILKKT